MVGRYCYLRYTTLAAGKRRAKNTSVYPTLAPTSTTSSNRVNLQRTRLRLTGVYFEGHFQIKIRRPLNRTDFALV